MFPLTAFANSSNVRFKNSTLNVVGGDQINYTVSSNRFQSLDRLQCAVGASFDPDKKCLPNTRTALLDSIWSWIESFDAKKSAEILLLTSIAGAGKTTVAHTIARRCDGEGLLSSFFFFDRNVAGRNTPIMLFSTIARDFAGHNEDFGERLTHILDKKRSLAEAPLSLHFAELILGPSRCLPLDEPVVIIIDSLDAGCDHKLLTILCDEVPKLPGTFRILLTSRKTREEFFLSKKPHVRSMSIVIDELRNLEDSVLYARHVLREVALWGSLDENWPGSRLLDDFVLKAGGLFIWIFIISEYLRMSLNPDAKLKLLLSKRGPSSLPTETKMDEMYSTILQACDWDDDDFVQGYGLLMGAIIAAKTPLSMSALGSLHRFDLSLPIKKYLLPLAPLLTNLDNDKTAVKILHISLKEFLTIPARSSPTNQKVLIREEEHSRRLGFLCLMLLNEDLDKCGSALGYLTRSSELEGVPNMDDNVISEEVSYACNFWMDHVVETQGPEQSFTDALQKFLGNHIIPWMEVVTSIGRFQDLVRLREWLQRTYPEDTVLKTLVFNPSVAAAFHHISSLLSQMDRREEACQAVLEAVELRRWLANDVPAIYTADLASSLRRLSYCLSELGYREDALDGIQEAVELYRQLANNDPAAFNARLASSLNNLSNRLSDMGHREGALDASREAVELLREVAKDQPAVVNAHLAGPLETLSNQLSEMGHLEAALDAIREAVELRRQLANNDPANLAGSLNTLSNRLSETGHPEEALDTIREAVKLYRHLASVHPSVFNSHLARAVDNLSIRLSDMEHREEALDASREAVELRRRLVNDHPAVFKPDLACSLINLSTRLSSLRRREEALDAIREAVELYRPLANDYPAAFNDSLSRSLNNFSNGLSEMGRQDEALATMREAVELRRQLVHDYPGIFNADLASSLNNLSNLLSNTGHREEGLDAIRETVELYRPLANNRPAVFTADLARALSNFSIRLSDMGQREEALDVIGESVKLFRPLATHRPVVFNAGLASSLNNFSLRLLDMGHREEALDAIRETVELCRPIANDNPAVFNVPLVNYLYSLSVRLSDMGHREEALDAIREAVELSRHRPPEYNANLLNALDSVFNRLSGLGHQEDSPDTSFNTTSKIKPRLAYVIFIVFFSLVLPFSIALWYQAVHVL